jgi:hypothetical protein
MICRLFSAAVLLGLLTAVPSATQAPAGADTAVILDVAVSDKTGPVTDLTQADFQVQDDGKKVELTSFAAILPSGTTAPGDGRDLVLVLDDAGVPMAGTLAIQTIANMFVQNARPGDGVAVLRLHNATDEVMRDPQVALARIAAYQAGSRPFVEGETIEDYLRLVTKVSRQWAESKKPRRLAIICIGSQAVCSPDERDSTAPRDMYPNWVNALTSTATAHVVAYAAVPGRVMIVGGGLVERTGGQVFGGLTNFAPAVEKVYRDLSHYYMVGYSPQPSKKDLRGLSVRVNRKSVTVDTRNKRGK